MKFEVLPVLELIHQLYEQPRTPDRFVNYLGRLQGKNKGDLDLPIMGYNPMAKDLAPAKVRELIAIGAEEIMADVLSQMTELHTSKKNVIKVCLNVSDDIEGAWSNRYSTDYDSKFKTSALLSRDLCAPYIWTSEEITNELVIRRTKEYAYRTAYQVQHGLPVKLSEHIDQEIYVSAICSGDGEKKESKLDVAVLKADKSTEEFNRIFNFLYGDEACASLGFPMYGEAPFIKI